SDPGEMITLGLTAGTNPLGKPLILQVQQGVHGVNFPYAPLGGCYAAFGDNPPAYMPPCQGEVIGFTTAPSSHPSVTFTCPTSGTFSVQWAPYTRSDAVALQCQSNGQTYNSSSHTCGAPSTPAASPTFAVSSPNTTASYPANEVQIFPGPTATS